MLCGEETGCRVGITRETTARFLSPSHKLLNRTRLPLWEPCSALGVGDSSASVVTVYVLGATR